MVGTSQRGLTFALADPRRRRVDRLASDAGLGHGRLLLVALPSVTPGHRLDAACVRLLAVVGAVDCRRRARRGGGRGRGRAGGAGRRGRRPWPRRWSPWTRRARCRSLGLCWNTLPGVEPAGPGRDDGVDLEPASLQDRWPWPGDRRPRSGTWVPPPDTQIVTVLPGRPACPPRGSCRTTLPCGAVEFGVGLVTTWKPLACSCSGRGLRFADHVRHLDLARAGGDVQRDHRCSGPPWCRTADCADEMTVFFLTDGTVLTDLRGQARRS